MKLVAGLGNPGRKYRGTRHNIGWEVLAELARRFAVSKPREKFNGEIVEADIRGEKVVLISPLTFMNRSGSCIQPARDFYKLENSQLLIVCDDFNLPAAKLRVRMKGSAGGQKGLQDVIQRLGTNEVARLRIGIGQPPDGWDVSSFVLSKFHDEECPLMEDAVRRAVQAVETWVTEGTAACMNRFNAAADQEDKKTKGKRQKADQPDDEKGAQKSPRDKAADEESQKTANAAQSSEHPTNVKQQPSPAESDD